MKFKAAPESAELVALRQGYDREAHGLRVEIAGLRNKLGHVSEQRKVEREGGQMLLGILARYQRAMRSLGWSPPDDELALVEGIRKELER